MICCENKIKKFQIFSTRSQKPAEVFSFLILKLQIAESEFVIIRMFQVKPSE